MLLRAELFTQILSSGPIYSQNSQLLLQNTVLGYVASGSVDQINENSLLSD